MKKTITILSFLFVVSLVGCAPARNVDHYYVGEYADGYSVLYKNEQDEVEQIVALGAQPQPLVIAKGRICFLEAGKLISVDLDGNDRQELALEGLPSGSRITYMDDTHLYCLADAQAAACWKVDLELTDYEEIPVPRKYRTVDYAALLSAIRTQVAASEDRIRVRNARAELDGNGTPIAMTLEVISHSGKVSGMEFWNRGTVTVSLPIGSIEVSYRDQHMPLSLADRTVEDTATLETLLTALETADNAEVAAKHVSGTANGFVLAYLQEEYDAAQFSAWLTVSGAESSAEGASPYFVLGQRGGADTALTDSEGLEIGNLIALRWES